MTGSFTYASSYLPQIRVFMHSLSQKCDYNNNQGEDTRPSQSIYDNNSSS